MRRIKLSKRMLDQERVARWGPERKKWFLFHWYIPSWTKEQWRRPSYFNHWVYEYWFKKSTEGQKA